MTKQEWLDCNDLEIMLKEVNNDRKRQLFALACCRSIEHLMKDQRSKDCLEKINLFIDGKIDEKELELASQAAWDVVWVIPEDWAARAIARAARAGVGGTWAVAWAAAWAEQTERFKQFEMVRDIYNPFVENIIFCNEAKNIAQQVYDGDNDARFILSDCLEENKFPEELYLHLKQPTHYKGCWVIDQILGKS